jgi:hypothetical protein
MPNSPPNSPVLLTPIDQAVIGGTTLVFVFTVPSDIDNDSLIFRLELDTNNPINYLGPNYKSVESRLNYDQKANGKWEVQNGVGTYVNLPQAGVNSTYYGRTAKVTIRRQDTTQFPNLDAVWYWRIGASDELGGLAIFDQTVFMQGVFSV